MQNDRTSMALNPEDMQKYIAENGPYMEHWTKPEKVPGLLKHGLLPAYYPTKDPDPDEIYMDDLDDYEPPQSETDIRRNWDGFTETRPGHVYLAKPGEIRPGMHENRHGDRPYQVPVNIDLRKLNLKNLKADEDVARDSWEDWKVNHPDPAYREYQDMEGPPPPNAAYWDAETPWGLADWAEEQGLDDPWETNQSLHGGALAHYGPISPEAISLHPEYMDKYPPEVHSFKTAEVMEPAVMEPGQIEDFDFENYTVADPGWHAYCELDPVKNHLPEDWVLRNMDKLYSPKGITWEEAKSWPEQVGWLPIGGPQREQWDNVIEPGLTPNEPFSQRFTSGGVHDWTINVAKVSSDYRNSKVAKDDPDPEYSFMYYKSAIEVVPWTHNVRYREVAQRLLNKFNTRLEDGGWKDDEGEWSGGDIYVQDDGLRVEFKHLANPEIQSSALQAIRHWYDNEMREKSNIDWEMEGEETRTGRTVKTADATDDALGQMTRKYVEVYMGDYELNEAGDDLNPVTEPYSEMREIDDDDYWGSPAEQAAKIISDEGCNEASSSDFHRGIWYSGHSTNPYTGLETETTCHLKGFTPEEEREAWAILTASGDYRNRSPDTPPPGHPSDWA